MTTAELIYLRETRQNLSSDDMRRMADAVDDVTRQVSDAIDKAKHAKECVEDAQKSQARLADMIAQQGDGNLLADFKDLQDDLQDILDLLQDACNELYSNFDNTENLF